MESESEHQSMLGEKSIRLLVGIQFGQNDRTRHNVHYIHMVLVSFFGVRSLLLLIAPKYVIHHLFSSYYLHYAKFMYGIYFRLILFSWLLFSQFFHQMA